MLRNKLVRLETCRSYLFRDTFLSYPPSYPNYKSTPPKRMHSEFFLGRTKHGVENEFGPDRSFPVRSERPTLCSTSISCAGPWYAGTVRATRPSLSIDHGFSISTRTGRRNRNCDLRFEWCRIQCRYDKTCPFSCRREYSFSWLL